MRTVRRSRAGVGLGVRPGRSLHSAFIRNFEPICLIVVVFVMFSMVVIVVIVLSAAIGVRLLACPGWRVSLGFAAENSRFL